MARLGFLGTGRMAGAMIAHLAPKRHEIRVTHHGRETSRALAAAFGNVIAAEAPEVVEASEIVFLCLRPYAAGAALGGLPFRGDHRVISVMAGIGRDRIAALCAPAGAVSLMLPMELIARGGCPIPVWPADPTVAALFEPENSTIPLPDEAALAACFAATMLVSAVAETLDAGAGWLGEWIGPAAAEAYVGQMVGGMLALHAGRAGRFAQLRDSLATAGTLNLSMVEALRALGLPGAVRTNLDRLSS
jgi:pyrroline-5-carboxylate reductase